VVGAENFSPHHCVQTASKAHPAYLMGIKGSSLAGTAAGT